LSPGTKIYEALPTERETLSRSTTIFHKQVEKTPQNILHPILKHRCKH